MNREPVTFTAATYNIHRCIGMDRRMDMFRISRVIRETGASVVGLQEVHSRTEEGGAPLQMDARVAPGGMAGIPGPTILRRDGHYGNLLLTAWPVLEYGRIDLTCRAREPRGGIEALLDVRGRPVRVLVTHLGLARWERREQVERLRDRLTRKEGIPVLFMGDINEWNPAARAVKIIRECMGRAPALPTFPSRYPLLSLDRIWVSPRSALAGLSVHRTPLARAASDHLPLKAEVRLP